MQEDASKYGLYSISAAKNSKLTKVSDAPNEIIANGGGIYLDGIYHFINYDIWSEKTTYYEYDTKTWKQQKREVLPDKTNVGIDEAYDPTTGNIYGCFTDAEGTSYVFGFVDHDTHQRTYISTPTVLYFAVAVSPEGVVYAIGSDGVLYRVDKTTGKQTKVGDTGLMPKYYQSAVFDMESGKLYWAACTTSGSSGLYEVNTQTGKATLLNAFPSREQVTGLFIPFNRAKEDAPAEVENLSASFKDASLSGKLSFTMPAKTNGGIALTSPLSYKVLLNGAVYATASAQPGEQIVSDITGMEGVNTMSVCAQSGTACGPISKLHKWLGYDVPVMTQPLLDYDGDKTLSLLWEKPTKSEHGGYLDADDIRYNVVRYPGALAVATNYAKTSMSQKLSPKQYTKYYYEVQAVSHGMVSGKGVSNAVGFGQAYGIPFDEDFTSSYTDYFNKEGEWLITPALDTSDKNVYEVTLQATNEGTDVATVELYMGDGCGSKDMTHRLASKTISAGSSSTLKAYMYNKSASGSFVGIKTSVLVSLSNLHISEGTTAEAPDSVKNLVAECPDGSNDVALTFVAPIKTINGKPLVGKLGVKILSGSTVVSTVDGVEPGQTCASSHVGAVDGWHEYTVVATSDVGEGMPASVNTFVGTDIPVVPSDVSLVDADGIARLTWTAPTIGVNGKYVNPAKLVYDIVRNDNSVVAADWEGTSFDDTSLDLGLSPQQSFCQYAVRARSVAGASAYAMSNAIVKGTPYAMPFRESFPSGSLSYNFWANEGNGGRWSVTTSQSSDDDGGSAMFTPSEAGADSRLYSGKIAIEDAASLSLNYDCYVVPGTDTQFSVELRYPDMSTEIIDAIDMTTYQGGKGWTKRYVTVPVNKVAGYCHLMFRVKSNDGATKVYVDGIDMSKTLDHDLCVQIVAPSEAKTGATAKISAIVKNVGGKPFDDNFTINLVADGGIAGTFTADGLSLGATMVHDFEYPISVLAAGSHTFRVELSAAADENTDNNVSANAMLKVASSSLPTIENLCAERVAGGCRLSWKAPVLEGEIRKLDDVESYEPFAIDNVGDWTMIDVDGSYTYGIASGSSYVDFPHALDAKSWIVFNAPKSGAQIYDNGGRPTGWMPRSGDQMFISFQDGDGATDDWMISPELPGYAQTISFYVKSINPSTHGFETFEVLYSTTDKELSSFTQITNIISEAPADWTEVKAELPDGAKYFAIRGTSAGHFALLVDDISYSVMDKASLHLLGYDIYADKRKVNEKPVEGQEYVVNNAEDVSRIDVAAVYAEGMSAPMGISFASGVSGPVSDGIRISSSDGNVYISGLSCRQFCIYEADGKLIYADSGKESVCIHLPRGMYVARIGEASYKITIQ